MFALLKNINLKTMSAPTRRRVFVISVGVVVLLLIVYGFLPKPVSVDTAAASIGPLRVTVEEEGRTRVKDRYVISAPVPGFLRRIRLEAGNEVKKGQRVAALEPLRSAVLDPRSRAEAEAAVNAARAALDAAKEKARAATVDAEYLKERADRSKQLFEGGFIARDQFDETVAAYKKADAIRLSAEAAVTTSRADLARAESALRYSAAGPGGGDTKETVVVRSPVSGRVLKIHRESEGVVNSGEPLLDVGNPKSLEVRVEVLSSDAVRIKADTPVLFERWGDDATLEGRVRIVEPSGFTKISSLGVEEQRVLVIVDFTSPFEVWRRLGDGYRLDATFVLWQGESVLQVPASAVFRKGEGWAAFVVQNGRARLREIEVGRRNGLQAEIRSGIAAGERVIIHPGDEIKDGTRVKTK